MGIYKADSDGRAPKGLSVGDQVVTGGGTYVITGVKADGSYTSVMYDSKQTTYNYRGRYDNEGPALTGLGSLQNPSAGQLENYYLKLLEQTVSGPSALAGASGGVISLQEAVKMADQALTPSYLSAYRQAADQAAQRLEKAGLYDTVYGQSLAAQAENQVSDELNSAVYKMALDLTGRSADYTSAQQENALNFLMKLLQQRADAAAQTDKLRSNEAVNREKLRSNEAINREKLRYK